MSFSQNINDFVGWIAFVFGRCPKCGAELVDCDPNTLSDYHCYVCDPHPQECPNCFWYESDGFRGFSK